MVERMRYKNLDHALRLFRNQVSESIPYALEELPRFETPEAAFKWLKQNVVYKKDPKGVELFQTLHTLLKNNFHGIPGAGDCDCFTIAALATLIANGFTDCGIVLVGRNALTPVHIYAYVDYNGQRHWFDLTNKKFDFQRPYPYRQEIPYKVNQTEKNMILQLADAPHAPNPGALQYLYRPSQGVYVREDYFDGMSLGQFQTMLAEEGYDLPEIAELSGRFFNKRMAKKEKKAAVKNRIKEQKYATAAKKPKNIRKTEKRKTKNIRVTGRNERGLVKAKAKLFKAQQPDYSPPPPQEPDYYNEQEYENQPSAYVEPEYEEQEEQTEVEVMPEEEPTEGGEIAQMFEGETDVLGESVPKMLLWGLGAALVGFGAGYATKSYRVKKKGVLSDIL